jgi:hypothetical protein
MHKDLKPTKFSSTQAEQQGALEGHERLGILYCCSFLWKILVDCCNFHVWSSILALAVA